MKAVVLSAITLGFLGALSASAQSQVRQLPDGRFTLVAGNAEAVNFIVENTVRRAADEVRLTTYRVYAQPISGLGEPIDQEITDLWINCVERTYRTAEINGFRSDGQWVAYLVDDKVRHIEPRQTWEFIAVIACGEGMMPDHMTVEGLAAARQLGLERLR